MLSLVLQLKETSLKVLKFPFVRNHVTFKMLGCKNCHVMQPKCQEHRLMGPVVRVLVI